MLKKFDFFNISRFYFIFRLATTLAADLRDLFEFVTLSDTKVALLDPFIKISGLKNIASLLKIN
jgi:hypothetical protein